MLLYIYIYQNRATLNQLLVPLTCILFTQQTSGHSSVFINTWCRVMACLMWFRLVALELDRVGRHVVTLRCRWTWRRKVELTKNQTSSVLNDVGAHCDTPSLNPLDWSLLDMIDRHSVTAIKPQKQRRYLQHNIKRRTRKLSSSARMRDNISRQ